MRKILRGQAAIEYLMTYGWALLVLVIVVVLISSSGIFSPSYLVSEECNLGPRFPCRFLLYSREGATHLDLSVDNGFGYIVKITGLTIQPEGGDPLTVSTLPVDPLQSGDTAQISAAMGRELGKGSTQIFRLQVTYYSCAPEVNPTCVEPDPGSSALHTVSGRIVGKVN